MNYKMISVTTSFVLILLLTGCKSSRMNEVYEGDWAGTLKQVNGKTREELLEYQIFKVENIQKEISKEDDNYKKNNGSLSSQRSIVQLLNISDFLGYENVKSDYFTKDDYIPTDEEVDIASKQNSVDWLEKDFYDNFGDETYMYIRVIDIADEMVNYCKGVCTSTIMSSDDAAKVYKDSSYANDIVNRLISDKQASTPFLLETLSTNTSHGYTTIELKITNQTNYPKNFIKVKVLLQDDNKKTLDVNHVYATGIDELQPNETKKFSIMFREDKAATQFTATVVE